MTTTITGATGIDNIQAATGAVLQVVNTQTGAYAAGTTAMNQDSSVPLNTEGNEYMSLAITPNNSSNTLVIDVVIFLSHGNATRHIMSALFKDSGTNAIAAGTHFEGNANRMVGIQYRHTMVAGTTNATTFKVRAGGHSVGTTHFNGESGAVRLGGVSSSSITIMEIAG